MTETRFYLADVT